MEEKVLSKLADAREALMKHLNKVENSKLDEDEKLDELHNTLSTAVSVVLSGFEDDDVAAALKLYLEVRPQIEEGIDK